MLSRGNFMTSPYSDCKIYGPFTRKEDDRLQITCRCSDGTRKTVSYPKYLMEIKLGRYLIDDEEVHHKDFNPQNNDINNLEVISRLLHSEIHAALIRYKPITIVCIWCGESKELTYMQTRYHFSNRRRKRNGPFCSKRCVGLYGVKIQKEKKASRGGGEIGSTQET